MVLLVLLALEILRARPMDPACVTDIRDQCARAGVAFFFKQGRQKQERGRSLLDGRTWDAMPTPPESTRSTGRSFSRSMITRPKPSKSPGAHRRSDRTRLHPF
jgi:hypothetical protein